MGMRSIQYEDKNGVIPKYGINEIEFEQNQEYEESISFSEETYECCVGIVDIVSSTKITATLPNSRIGKYYSIFLNTMNSIVKKFGGIVVKNGGDSLLYYFPDKDLNSPGYERCLECSLAMIDAHYYINKKLSAEKMPQLDYRVSADYGKITLAKASNSTYADIFGSAVNMCAKINCMASKNSFVIGGDLYRVVKNLPRYQFPQTKSYSIGFKYEYPLYMVQHINSGSKMIPLAIEETLREISIPALEEVIRRLFNQHKCMMSECYENPEYLSSILREIFGSAHTSIIESVKTKLGEYSYQGQVREFLDKLAK